MDTKKSYVTVLATVVLIISVAGAVALAMGITNDFNSSLGYFNNGSVYAFVTVSAIILSIFFGLVLWIISKKDEVNDRILPGVPIMPVFFVLGGLGFLSKTIVEGLHILKTPAASTDTVFLVSWAFSLLATVSMIMLLINGFVPASALTCVFQFFPVLYLASCILLEYFDRSVAVNSPIKILGQLALVAFMLMFTAEAGFSLGRFKLYSRYLFTLCLSASFGIITGGAGVFCYISEKSFSIPLGICLMLLILSLYSLSRLYGAAYKYTDLAPGEEVTVISAQKPVSEKKLDDAKKENVKSASSPEKEEKANKTAKKPGTKNLKTSKEVETKSAKQTVKKTGYKPKKKKKKK